jgi:CSLREA domain-containing protein
MRRRFGTLRVGSGLRCGMLALCAAGLLLATPAGAGAATITVTTTIDELDSGPRCALREAIWAANNDANGLADGCVAGSGNDRIVVPAGRFRLTRSAPFPAPNSHDDNNVLGDLDVTESATIVHRGIRPATIDSRVGGERVLHVFSTGDTITITLIGLTITGGEFSASEQAGGGILNEGVLAVRESLIVGNTAAFGAGLSTEGNSTATLVNSTVSGNRADTDGGGISAESDGTVNLRAVTISNNQADAFGGGGGDGGGIFASSTGGGGIINLRNTLIGGNVDNGREAHDCAKLGNGQINSLGLNMITNTNGCNYTPGPGDVLNRSARILPLTANGGPTETHALRKTSPAINRGASCGATDQRGVTRRLGGRCDIGAWELARCMGVVINLVGTNGPELLVGSPTADGILGRGSQDTLRGVDGNDGLCGGAGPDFLEGGSGSDDLDGGPGRDTCRPGSGRAQRVIRCELPRQRPGRGR